MKKVVLDFETRSSIDLKKSGSFKYSEDPSTQPTCLAFKIRNNSKMYFLNFKMVNKQWPDLPLALRILWQRLISEKYEFTCHNALFETVIYKNILVKKYGWPNIPFRQFRCTAAKAAACALPRNLEGAGSAMRLTTQKDKRGLIAMLQICKPTKQWNAWDKKGKIGIEPPKFLEPEAAPHVWQTLYDYCKIDVITEELLDQSLPDLTPFEQEVWFLNQQLNWRGLRVDIPTIRKIVGIMEVESTQKLKKLDTLTMGLVTKPGARQSILDFLETEGVKLKDIRAKTVEDTLKENISDDAKTILQLRQALSKTSTKKYQAIQNRAGKDNRVRDILLYHGASTGRDSGTGVQLQNLPRTLINQKDIDYVLELLQEKDDENPIEWIRSLYGDPSVVFSSLIRSMVTASPNQNLFVGDFAKIEVAVLWWLADNKPGLKVLNEGQDPYKYLAAFNTGKRYEDITDDGDDRQLAKAQTLGAGFGLGWSKFKETAWSFYRLKLSDEQSKAAINSYRTAYPTIPTLWNNYEQAAIRAIESNVTVSIGKCKFFCKDKFLWITLPSGRRLAYREPQIAWRVRKFEVDEHHPVTGKKYRVKRVSAPKKTVEFWAPNSLTKKWGLERTYGGRITENIVQAVARDLMAAASLRLEKAKYKVLLTVHDEILTERPNGEGSVEEFKNIMCNRPKWADEHLPIDAKAWKGPRYRK